MQTDNLIKMANNIGDFFSAEPEREHAILGIADHIQKSWELRMRQKIIEHYKNGGEGLNELVKEAIGRL
ncbi:formate dehydrogenase subunit delta [Beggiatoa leptomitoformis]|uniref:Formate dehydrogenase n=1 Tax=Beggiatoa leptomitoformis TaxID=288004 RepID=A0A2N9YGK8_9GAMM|nr:formate dehydrogenase subunit delta [Beggiatoa leptomitoformis]ALG68069.1 formate dehydrogenase [Beggiatoa leptomitoformis]AUI69640.1 formate dehydrogenase [Beggiatoa leptomitoformis]